MLERLQESDVADFLAAEFPGSELPRGLATIIHQHSDGNPLFITAMLDHLVHQDRFHKRMDAEDDGTAGTDRPRRTGNS